MIRLLLLVACLVFQGCASTAKTDSFITTVGVGSSLEAAKQDAFRNAIEIQIGLLIHSDRVHRNELTIKNDILAYSAGYVDDYKVVNSIIRNGSVHMTVDVKVSTSKIQNRILSEGIDSTTVNGSRLKAQYSTFLQEKHSGDKLLAKLVDQYPHNAYEVTTGTIQYKHDIHRNSILSIPYKLTWNRDYIQSLNETLAVLSDPKPGLFEASPRTVTVKGRKKSDIIIGFTEKYHFNETVRFDYINRVFDNRGLFIRVALMQGESELYSECWSPPSKAYYSSQYSLVFEGNETINSEVSINIPSGSKLYSVMQRINNVQLTVIDGVQCAKVQAK